MSSSVNGEDAVESADEDAVDRSLGCSKSRAGSGLVLPNLANVSFMLRSNPSSSFLFGVETSLKEVS